MSDLQKPSNDDLRAEASEESPTIHRVEVVVPAKRVRRAFDRAYRDLAGRVQVKGFRPGKVPKSVLERLYGPSLAEQLEHTIVAETLGDALEQVEIEPVAEPTIEAGDPVRGEEFQYVARVEVKPPIELPDLAGLPAQRPRVEVGDSDVERELENLRQRSAPILEEPEDTAVANGHIAALDFVGRIGGQPFEGGSGQGVDVEIGSGQFIPGFEEQLVGARAAEDVEVTVQFPDDYGNPELAGQEAVFAVHVATIKRREVAALDDEFAKDLGDFESLDDLKQRVRGDLEEKRERSARSVLHATVMDSLIERTSFPVPSGMLERRLEQELYSASQRLAGQVPEEAIGEQLARWKEEWRERVERQLREAMLLEAIAKAEGLAASPEDVEARVHEMAQQQGVDAARLRQAFGGDDFERGLERQLVDEKALEFLVARAKVEETTDT